MRWHPCDVGCCKSACGIAWNDDVIKWKHFPRYWPFARGIHRSTVNSPHKGQWRGALMFSLICAWMNGWVNNREAGDLRRQHGHYDVIVMRITHYSFLRFYFAGEFHEISEWTTKTERYFWNIVLQSQQGWTIMHISGSVSDFQYSGDLRHHRAHHYVTVMECERMIHTSADKYTSQKSQIRETLTGVSTELLRRSMSVLQTNALKQ